MVAEHPSRSALSTSLITSSRISAQPTTRHRLRGERGGRGTTSSRTTTRAANELSPPKSACDCDAVLRTSTRGTVHMGQSQRRWGIEDSIERERCLLVLNSVTSTPQWIRQPEAAWLCVWCLCVWCLCVSKCSDILGSLSL